MMLEGMSEPDRPNSEKMFALMMRSPDLVALFDPEDRLQAANPAYCAAYHCDPAQQLLWRDIMRTNYQNKRGPLIETEDIEAWLTDACARRATLPYRAFEAELHNGKWIWITETVSADGWMFFHASNISSLRASSRHLRKERDAARRESWTDALTGVPNRRYVMTRLEDWFEAQRLQQEFGTHSLAIVDLDNFKTLNDRFGHEFGDAVLTSFCRDAVSSIRPLDLFGRIGGEEFLFLMPNCPLEVAQNRLNLLQRMIRHPGHSAESADVTYSFSAGLVLVRDDKDIHHAIRRADKLMYRAKLEGRARVLC
ncbi:diguanylate cyclase [Roseinatronobacter monicus]|uniref:diguanylate cyclase n=2 Tax=Roseinatronobacter monicus TaxID=393481 RepID=A0A543KGY5_9RHOB|nr:diguanylate cyclase [Roseinatronobacter monicus]